jgi:cGMP-dependent protein kinase 2
MTDAMTDKVQVAIIGSGPAGMSAASRAAARGMSHVMIEGANRLADTIQRYQKKKHIMATPGQLTLRSDFAFEAGQKEIILKTWEDAVRDQKVNVLFGADVKKITGATGNFTIDIIKDGKPAQVLAEKVVLAIGTQSNPNLVRCPVGEGAVVQYSLDDPGAYLDEHIAVIGGGDAGIENALGLIADAALGNVVMLLNRGPDFPTAKAANVKALLAAEAEGRISVIRDSNVLAIDKGTIKISARDGEIERRCDRVIARMGSAPPRAFVEACCAEFAPGKDGKPAIVPGTGIRFTSPDRVSYPQLSPVFETSVPGIYVIGALAGYPLIKHCMNQGYDVIEFIAGNTTLKGADEPILEDRLSGLPGKRSVAEWLDYLRQSVTILNDVSGPQMREFMIDSRMRTARAGEIIFERNTPGSSLFAIADGAVTVSLAGRGEARIEKGSIFGEVGLISGRPRGSTVIAATDTILIEVPRMAALKLSAQVPAAGRALTRISIERQLLQTLGSGVTAADLAPLLETAEIVQAKAGEPVITEGAAGLEIYVVRSGSMTVEKQIAGRNVFLSYLPAGSVFGEMALLDQLPRNATVRAAIRSELIKLDGTKFTELLEQKPALAAKLHAQMATRQEVNTFIEASKNSFSSAVDMYSSVAGFLVESGVGEATDVLLIDETLCVGCDNCEKACADSHEGVSRLDREAGRTYAHMHVPTSCRHCEHPHCMSDCPPNAIHRGPDGEVVIDDTCIGCGNCVRNCPYDVIRLDHAPPKKPGLLQWLMFGRGPGPGEPGAEWSKKHSKHEGSTPSKAIKCDMCSGIEGGPACVRACPTGAAIRVAPEQVLSVARLEREIS